MEYAVKSNLSASLWETSKCWEKQDFSHTPFSHSKCHHRGITCSLQQKNVPNLFVICTLWTWYGWPRSTSHQGGLSGPCCLVWCMTHYEVVMLCFPRQQQLPLRKDIVNQWRKLELIYEELHCLKEEQPRIFTLKPAGNSYPPQRMIQHEMS